MAVFWVAVPCSLVRLVNKHRDEQKTHRPTKYWYLRFLRRQVWRWLSMMEAASTPETSVSFYQTARRNNPEDSHRHTRRRENLKYQHFVSLCVFFSSRSLFHARPTGISFGCSFHVGIFLHKLTPRHQCYGILIPRKKWKVSTTIWNNVESCRTFMLVSVWRSLQGRQCDMIRENCYRTMLQQLCVEYIPRRLHRSPRLQN
jgi:hypothetical protein